MDVEAIESTEGQNGQMSYMNGMCCPFVHCDHCGRKIEDYSQAIAVFRTPPEGDVSNAVRHIHKVCDYKQRNIRLPRELLWQPLEEHLDGTRA